MYKAFAKTEYRTLILTGAIENAIGMPAAQPGIYKIEIEEKEEMHEASVRNGRCLFRFGEP